MFHKKYEFLAKLSYSTPLYIWHHENYILPFHKYFILTEEQLYLFTEGHPSFINGEFFDEPPEYITIAWTKRKAWKNAVVADK
jgi:hypothetical protein